MNPSDHAAAMNRLIRGDRAPEPPPSEEPTTSFDGGARALPPAPPQDIDTQLREMYDGVKNRRTVDVSHLFRT